jgi:hypothetical protein
MPKEEEHQSATSLGDLSGTHGDVKLLSMGVIEIWREMRMIYLSISIDFVVCLTIGGV